ncbi:MAG: hypothetical protein FD156_2771 [Nitrospirae bacterium]|nr:MAG: hypothetical protein FD156_2771 [Nitrospirota bacterium]
MKSKFITAGLAILLLICAGIWIMPGIAMAHCDTLDGPVVATAKAALENGDLTPVLKWVKKDDEQDIRELFQKTLRVRKQGKEAKELADMYFFETLVRIHRAGEGAPYTGLKPGGTVEPSIAAADKALETGSADSLLKMVSEAVAAGIRKRFEHAKETKKHAEESVEAGREFVEAYVEFTHYVERLHMNATALSGHHAVPETGEAGGRHQH